ncbi:MAG: homoserine kinase [Elusimicrobia bacterium]|nr:homoserine kinase [Elusimicrobiota bacterium]
MRASRLVRVTVPATTSNLGPGFDVLGMALTLRMSLTVELGAAGALDRKNLITASFLTGLKKRPVPAVRLTVASDIPQARGLGSSAAARLCGLLAAAALEGFKTTSFTDVVAKACALEGHPDNAVPAAYGGLRSSLMENGQPLGALWPVPKDLGVTVCVPDYEVETERARGVLPKKVTLHDAAANAARVAHLLSSLRDGRLSELRPAMRDALHQPYRARILPGFSASLEAAYRAGACGAALSGSGSAVLAFVPKGRTQERVGRAMEKAFAKAGKSAKALTLSVDKRGASVEWA